MKLLNSQKDSIYESIENAGLSPFQFEFVEELSKYLPPEKATILKYKETEYFFNFETYTSSTDHFAICCPEQNAYVETLLAGATWDRQLKYLSQWLEYLKREINTPNKWKRLEREIEGIRVTFNNDEDKFSVHEYEDLKSRMEALKQGVNAIGLLPEQLSAINNKLDHLTDVAKDLSKFDWKSIFVGTIISLFIQLAFTPENTKLFWDLVKRIFSNYLLP